MVQVAVFDTAFHQTMPPHAFLYALPWELYDQDGIRRYGAHGTSYKYLVQRAAAILGRDASQINLIIAHVGMPQTVCPRPFAYVCTAWT